MSRCETRLVLEPFDACAELARFAEGRPEDGAVASFIGVARGQGGGEGVSALVLDHYPGFTERSLEAIAEDARFRFQVSGVLVVHRAGRIAPGEAIVLAAAAAPHRRAALDTVDYLMDRLKTDAAFWKREETGQGSRWVEPTEQDRKARANWEAAWPGSTRA